MYTTMKSTRGSGRAPASSRHACQSLGVWTAARRLSVLSALLSNSHTYTLLRTKAWKSCKVSVQRHCVQSSCSRKRKVMYSQWQYSKIPIYPDLRGRRPTYTWLQQERARDQQFRGLHPQFWMKVKIQDSEHNWSFSIVCLAFAVSPPWSTNLPWCGVNYSANGFQAAQSQSCRPEGSESTTCKQSQCRTEIAAAAFYFSCR